jgi:glycosyltransferase involved in cell wall biosynthesis
MQKLGITSDTPVILCTANLVPVKGVELLIDALNELKGAYPKARLLILGDDSSEYASALKTQADVHGLTNSVTFLGKQQNVNDYLALADVFVLPTLMKGRMEGCNVSLIEAMASARYCIASDIPGMREQLMHHRDLLFKPGDTADLTNKLRHALSLPAEERTAIGESLRQEVLERFTIEKEVAQHEAFYKKVLDY